MQAASWEPAPEQSKGARVVAEAAKADEDFGVSGIVIEPWSIVDTTPPIRPDADTQLTPPATVMLACSRRREAMTPVIL